MTNKPLISVVAAVLMAGGQAAHAGTCPADAVVTTIETAGFSCTLGDKTFSDFALSDVPTTAMVGFGQFGPLSSVTLARVGHFFPAGLTTFDYTVAVTSGTQTIGVGTIGIGVSFPTVTSIVTMNGRRLTPTAMNNGGTAMIDFGPGVTSVRVLDSSFIAPGADLDSMSSDFGPRMSLPEPTSLALFGLGLAGLALFARRRRS